MVIPVPSVTPCRARLIEIAQTHYNSNVVRIDDTAIADTPWPVNQIRPMWIAVSGAKAERPESALAFLLAMNSLNYRFWNKGTEGSIQRYTFAGKTGARALWVAFEQAWGNHATPEGLTQRLENEPTEVLFGDMPALASRHEILGEILQGGLLQIAQRLSGDILASGKIDVSHASQLAEQFPQAYDDPLLKKAQLALSMFGGFLRTKGMEIDDSGLTAMADYQVPRVLRALGVLVYSDELAAKIRDGVLFAEGSKEEWAIRSATLLACDRIARQLCVSAAAVDNLLWLSQHLANDTPFHLCETTWY